MISPVPDNTRVRISSVAAAFVVIVAAGCAGSAPTAHSTPGPKKTATAQQHAGAKSSASEAACTARPAASGDIYVFMVTPGSQPLAQRLGGEWIWNVTLKKCLTSVQMMMAAAPRGSGFCTEVGYVKDNPGYNPNATPAHRLKKVAGINSARLLVSTR